MRGPEHYREAERALEIADSDLRNNDAEGSSNYIARAQVHATLAVAAATALTAGDSYHAVQADMTEWRTVAGNQTPAEEQRERMGGQP